MDWWKQLQGTVRRNEPLSRHTTFRIGGAAEFFVEPRNAADLKLLIESARKHKKRILILGGGSNLLVSDKGFKGIVVSLSAPAFKKARFDGTRVYAGAGLSLNRLAHLSAGHGLSGFEFFAGIPGSVGGAVVMNAGAWGKNIEDFVEIINVMDYNGVIKSLKKKDIGFQYRHAGLAGLIILESIFKLHRLDKGSIQQRIRVYRARRAAVQDVATPSAGCIFKNPSGSRPAGKLIDDCGLKGAQRGDAAVSEKHANFIVNRSRAKSRDVLRLMSLIQKRVHRKFGVFLEPEVKIIR